MTQTIASKLLRLIANDNRLMELSRRAIEDALVEYRDSRFFLLRNNGLCIKDRDGKDSSLIRMGSEEAVRIALRTIADFFDTREREE